MTQTSTSPLAATAALSLLMVGVPLWVFTRLTQPLLPAQPSDIVLGVALLMWLLAIQAILSRDEVIHSATTDRTSPTSHARRLVDRSILGVGFDAPQQQMPQLHLVAAPQVLSADQLPPQVPHGEFAQGRIEPNQSGPLRSVPVLHSDKPAAASILETQEYVVARGDTFWSIAEVVLGDGRDWQQLQDLNIGREVAPGVSLTPNHELRIGWSVLLPIPAEALQEEADHVA